LIVATTSLLSPLKATGGATALRQAMILCRPHVVAAAAFSALVNLLYLTPTLYMLLVYDRVVPTNGLTTLVIVSAITLVALGTLAALDWLRSRLLIRASSRLERELAGPVMSAILENAGVSRLERGKAMRQFDVLRQSIGGPGSLAIFDAPWAPIYIVAAFLLHPAIGLLCLASALLLISLAWLNEVATRAPLQAAGEAMALAYAQQDQASALAAEIRALGMTKGLVAKQVMERSSLINLQTRASFAAVSYASVIRFSRLTLQSAVLGLGAYLTIRDQISAGAVIAASLLLSRALAPIEQIVGSWKGIIQARSAYADLDRLFKRHADAAYTMFPAPLGKVTIDAVTCFTGDRRAVAIENLSLSIEPGQFIGVLGPSGAGKSTLLRLIAGAVEPERGVIRIDGAALTEWDPARLARHIGYFPQDFALLSGTIRDNISRFDVFLGHSPEQVDAQVITAAELAGVHHTILSLPNGYQTVVGLGGSGLSAGQTQRVALARALYGRPRLLILDEPNAHLDIDSEAQLNQTLGALKDDGVTIVVAAHRGAVLAAADKLLLLSAGRIDLFGSLVEVAHTMRARSEAIRPADQPHGERTDAR
jgi:PrtD family type I secretion system ABC transporter